MTYCRQILIVLSCIYFLFSCSEEKKTAFKMPDNTVALIAGNSTKVWKLAKRSNNGTRMNMGDCFLSYRVTYQTDSIMHDNNGDRSDCGETLAANWSFYTSK